MVTPGGRVKNDKRINHRSVTPEIEEHLITLYNEGKTLEEIRNIIPFTKLGLQRVLHRLNDLKRITLRDHSTRQMRRAFKEDIKEINQKLDLLLDALEIKLDELEETKPQNGE